MWEINARIAEKVYGSYVDWDEEFYNCPECGEPIYKCDWKDEELDICLCPICNFNDEDYFSCDTCGLAFEEKLDSDICCSCPLSKK